MLNNVPAVPAISDSGITKKDVALMDTLSSNSNPGTGFLCGPWNMAWTIQTPSMFDVKESVYTFMLGSGSSSVVFVTLRSPLSSGSFQMNVTPVTAVSVEVAVAVTRVPGGTSKP